MDIFSHALEMVLEHEGGYVNDPDDPGGETKYGISKRAYPTQDIANLTPEDAAEIYHEDYWQKVKGDYLPEPVALIVFDGAVNMGVSRAAKQLQRVAGTRVDGIIGSNTIKAVTEAYKKDGYLFLLELFLIRQSYYQSLSLFSKYGSGWTTRNAVTLKESFKWKSRS